MDAPGWVGLIIHGLVTLGALAAVIYRSGRLTATMELKIGSLQTEIKSVREERMVLATRLEKIDRIDTVDNRTTQLERATTRCLSDIRELKEQNAEQRGFRKAMTSRTFNDE